MRYRFVSDCHTHSNCSPDGHDSVEDMLLRAKELGLYALTITDHCECQAFDGKYRPRSQKAWKQMQEAKVPAGLRFYMGIELGQPLQNRAAAREALDKHRYDFVIGSLHNLQDRPDFCYFDKEKSTIEDVHALLSDYWEQLKEMISWGDFDTLGHLTYPLRYIQGEYGLEVDMERHREAIDGILGALLAREIALEVNTSGLRQKLGRTMPDLDILKRFYEMGGRLVTLGSDAHRTEDLAKGIEDGMDLLKEAGFTEFVVYENRTPVMLPLD